ncbi:hypothetical protein BOX15_Mlig004385g20 [Macrostomum lignano]|nr:hypothetical protein BOX15_Mlig004385g20 [Macrostomum lignano]
MEMQGILRKAATPYISPILLVKKKPESPQAKPVYRLCVDFRDLNQILVPERQCMPRIPDLLAKLKGSEYFTTLDMAQAFFQVALEEESQKYCGISTPDGQTYVFTRAPMGLQTSPAALSRAASLILQGINRVSTYVDDLLVFNETFEDHLETLKATLEALGKYGMKLKLQKCKFAKPTITFLGHKIDKNGIQIDRALVDKVQKVPKPQNVTQLRCFLGLCNFFRKHVPNYAKKAKPLTDLLKGTPNTKAQASKTPLKWTEEATQTFEDMKKWIAEDLRLTHPDFNKQFIVSSDASTKGIGAMLSQKDETGKEKPIAFTSRQLREAETRYAVTHLELLAVFYAFKTFEQFLYAAQIPTLLRIDHAPLRGLLTGKTLRNNQVLRWLLYLQQFQMQIEYVPGASTKHAVPDALSRLYEDQETPINFVTIKHPIPHLQALKEAQAEDPFCQGIRALWEQKPMDDSLAMRYKRHIQRHLSDYADIHGIIHRTADHTQQIVLPFKYRETICHSLHALPLAAHLGFDKTLERIRRHYFWISMVSDIRTFCQDCMDCAKNKSGQLHKGLIQMPEIPMKPMDKLSVDLVGPMVPTKIRNETVTHILTILCCFSKFAFAFPIPDLSAETTAETLFQVFCMFGIPMEISTDNGKNFTASLLAEALEILGVKHIFSSTYHPQANHVERLHSTLHNMLRHYTAENPNEWHKYLSATIYAYNTAKQSSSTYSPFELVFARKPLMPTELTTQLNLVRYMDEPSYAARMQEAITLARDIARHHLKVAQEKNTGRANKNRMAPTLAIGTRVMLQIPMRQGKHQAKFTGPYEIVKRNSVTSVMIRKIDDPTQEPFQVHTDRLKPIASPTPKVLLPDLRPSDPRRLQRQHRQLFSKEVGVQADDETLADTVRKKYNLRSKPILLDK